MALLVALALLAVALLVLFLTRGILGARLAQSYLRRRGVESSIVVEALGPGGFTARARLGPANHPDLVVERMEVTFAPLRGLAAPEVRSIRLVRPALKVGFDGQRLSFGSLQRLVDEALARPPGRGPAPDVTIEQGRAAVVTPAGVVRLQADAALPAGRLDRLDAVLLPGPLALGDQRMDMTGGRLELRGGGDRFDGGFRLALAQATWSGLRAKRLATEGRFRLPRTRAGQPGFEGPLSLDAHLRSARLDADGAAAHGLQSSLRLAGVLRGPADRLAFSGSASAAGTAAGLRAGGGFTGLAVSLSADLENLALERARDALGGSGRGRLTLSVERAQAGRRRAEGLRAQLRTTQLRFGLGARTSWSASLEGHAEARRLVQPLSQGPLELRPVSVSLRGRASAGPNGISAVLRGAAQAQGGLGAAAAERLAAALPVLGSDPPYRRAVAGLLRSARLQLSDAELSVAPDRLGVALHRNAVLVSGSGARIVVAPNAAAPLAAVTNGRSSGAFAATVAGGGLPALAAEVRSYHVAGESLQANGAVRAAGDLGPLRQARLQAAGSLSSRAGRLQIVLGGCGDASLGALISEGKASAERVAARLCPEAGAPALASGPDGWRVQLRAEAARGYVPVLLAQIRNATAHVEAAGLKGAAVTAEVQLAGAEVVDAGPQLRFRRLRGSGHATLAADIWRGAFDIAEGRTGAPIAAATLRHTMTSGEGEAEIRAPNLAFAPGGLQPTDVSPLLAALGSEVSGSGAFAGRIGWSKAGLTSSGRFTTEALDFRSRFGLVKQARVDVGLASLVPVVTAPAQRLTARHVDWLIPLDDIEATYAVTATAVELAAARARMAKGTVSVDAISFPFKPGQTISAVVHLDEVDLGSVLATLGLGDAVTADARVDGTAPFTAGPEGVRIAGGRIFATGPGRLSVSRQALASATAAEPAAGPNAMQDFAYQAMENLAFDQLEAQLQSRPGGRLGIVFHVRGRHDPPSAAPTRLGVLELLRGRAFDKPIPLPKGTPIELTLDTSINFDELMHDYAALNARSGPVQP